jgi:PAS domain S-box-containing protein
MRMNSLKRKLAFSYGILIVVILAVSLWGVYHLVRLGDAIDVILVNNYKSIIAAENMKEALERQDSAALFFMAGHEDKARGQFVANSEKFLSEFQTAANNITEPGESETLAKIDAAYSAYKQEIERFLASDSVPPGERSAAYFSRIEPSFLAMKSELDELLRLNQEAMIAASDRALRQSRQAQISTVLVAVAALGIVLVFGWRFTRYIVDPISTLTDKAKLIAEGDFGQHIDISSRDEIGVLAAEFNRMAVRLRDSRKLDQWQILAEQKKSDAVIDLIDDSVIVTDREGRVAKINKAAEQLFGISRDQIKTDGASAQPEPGSAEQILRTVENAVAMQRPVALTEEPAIVPIKVGDQERGFRFRTKPMRDADGRLLGAVTLLEDATEIREVDRLKDDFISVASKKLQGPLHSLRMALHALIEGYAGDLSEKQEEMLLTARQDGEQLDELMSDLIELADVQSGRRRFSIEPVRPIDAARPVIAHYQPLAESKHVTLSNEIWSDMRVMADKAALTRIIDNLVSNAIRHTGRDGSVTIKSWERHNSVFVSVRDTGEGIPAEHLHDLFGRFVHVEGTAGGGTGLGLALVKRLVEAQNGQVSVESKVGEGTTFTFSLPVVDTRIAK